MGSRLPLASPTHGTSHWDQRGEKGAPGPHLPLRELLSNQTRKSTVEHTKAQHGDLPQSQALAQEPQELHLALF